MPVVVLSGKAGPHPSTICLLSGSTQPLSGARLAELYSSKQDYLRKYRAAIAKAIRQGFALTADRRALLGFADPSRI